MPSRSSAAVAVVSVVLLLTGCAAGASTTDPSKSSSAATPSATPSSTALTCATSGSASDAVKVSDATSTSPKVDFPSPMTVTTTERTVVKNGAGAEIQQGDSVELRYLLFDAKSGKPADPKTVGALMSGPFPIAVDAGKTLAGLAQALVCTHIGERFAAVLPASAAFGSTGSTQLGIGGGDSVVLVADVVGLVPEKADGKAQALPSGFPKVTLAGDGRPTVSIPSADPPTTLKIADSKVGSGEVVKQGDSVTLQYQGVLWRNGTVFDESWGKTGPTALTAASGSVIEGFAKALIGQKVNSQVVVIIPPADGYGKTGSSDGTIKGTDTLVFVIDILSTSHAS